MHHGFKSYKYGQGHGGNRHGHGYGNGHIYEQSIVCSNCQCLGHTSKHCPQPITSYGVIVFRIRGMWNQASILSNPERQSLNGLENLNSAIEFLMIQRRDSIGFVEIMRGKYKIQDTDYIIKQFQGMTIKERERIKTMSFESLWEDLWGIPAQMSNTYKHEKEVAKQKLESLRSGEAGLSLDELYARAGSAWDTPEWGFPKGRRDANESEYKCAMRDLWEDTNLKEAQVIPIQGLEPIAETFFGSNHVHYCHKYFIAYAPPATANAVDYATFLSQNTHMQREIGDLGWFTAEEALKRIRPENIEKREILLRVCSLLRNYCPLMIGGGISESGGGV